MSLTPESICLLGPFTTASIIERFDASHRSRLRALPGMGGYGLTALVIARLRAGLPTEVITLDPHLPAKDGPVVFETDGLRYTICPRRSQHMVRDLFRTERNFLSRAIAESRASLYHANWTYEYALAAIDSGRPTLITVRDQAGRILKNEGIMFLGHYLMARMVFRRHRFFSAISPYVSQYVGHLTGHDVPVIGNPVPDVPQEWSSGIWTPFENGACRIVSAASWAKFKNIATALQSFARFRRQVPGARYQLFGPGLESDGPAAQWAARHGIDQGIVFSGMQAHADVLKAFRQADLVWHPSIEDAFGNPIVEGLIFARPLVASRQAAGSAWLIQHDQTGLLADGHDPESMTAALLTMYRNPERASTLGRQGREDIMNRFSTGSILTAYDRLYQRILEAQP